MPTTTPTAGAFMAAIPVNFDGDTEVPVGLTEPPIGAVPVANPELPYTGATEVPADGFATPEGCPLGIG